MYITLLLRSKAETLLVEQPCYIQTKIFSLYRKMSILLNPKEVCEHTNTDLGSVSAPDTTKSMPLIS